MRAREIVRYARKNGVNIQHYDVENCARGIVARMYGLTMTGCSLFDPYHKDLPAKSGRSLTDLSALEVGFESMAGDDDETLMSFVQRGGYKGTIQQLRKNRYYKVGQNVARLAKLAF